MIQKNRIQKLMLALLLLALQTTTMTMNKRAAASKRSAQGVSKLDPAKQEAMRKRVMARWVQYGDEQLAWDHNDASPEVKVAIESVAIDLINREARNGTRARSERADQLLAATKYPQAEGLAQILRVQGAQEDRYGEKAAARRERRLQQEKYNQYRAKRYQELLDERARWSIAEQAEKAEQRRVAEQRAAEQCALDQRELLRQKEWVDQNFSNVLSDIIPVGCPPCAIGW